MSFGYMRPMYEIDETTTALGGDLSLFYTHLAVRMNNKVLCMLKYSKFFHKNVRDR